MRLRRWHALERLKIQAGILLMRAFFAEFHEPHQWAASFLERTRLRQTKLSAHSNASADIARNLS
jgi:hypothetical protein